MSDGVNSPLAIQGGLTETQGSFQVAIANGVSTLISTLFGVAVPGAPDIIGEITLANNSGAAVWLLFAGKFASEKLEVPTGSSFTYEYAKMSEIRLGNDSGGAIIKSDPPTAGTTLSVFYRGVEGG